MRERRVVFNLNVSYRTALDQVAAIPGMLREVVSSHDKIRFDRAHFSKFGDSALGYEVVYFVTDPDYTLYMDLQQSINLKIFEWFVTNGVQFAIPTQPLLQDGTAPRTAGRAAESFMPPKEASAGGNSPGSVGNASPSAPGT